MSSSITRSVSSFQLECPCCGNERMGKSPSPLLLPMWLAENNDDDKNSIISRSPSSILSLSAPSNFFLAKSGAIFLATISLLGAGLIVAVQTLPTEYANILCPQHFCEDYRLSFVLCLLPAVLISGFVLNVALWCGIRWHKPGILTVWMVVYEMIFYLQLLIQVSNILPLSYILKSLNIVGFLTSWLFPIILLFLNRNFGQVILHCREEIREDVKDKKIRQKRIRPSPYLFGHTGRHSTSGGGVGKVRNINHFLQLPKFAPTEFQRHFNSGRRDAQPDKIVLIH